jgi:exopolyphosphatase/guanosine-5'-triphosphate,3'-diphosphate pyrophosphatase
MTRVAAIDCGTNSIRLLIADVDPQTRKLTDVDRRMEVVRLGQGVDRTGVLAPEALARTLAAAKVYAQACEDAGVTAIRFVATSATRDARNRDEFVRGVEEALGVQPEVVPGSEEAALSFAGAIGDFTGVRPAPFLVVDLGGGSTEVVLGETSVRAALSVDVGCVRMTERHLHSDPPSEAELAGAGADIDAAFDKVAAVVPLAETRTMVGVAGTVTTVAAHALKLDGYDPRALHGSRLSVTEALSACDSLIAMPRDERAALPFMHPGRIDVIGAGALIWRQLIARVAEASGITHVMASEKDILDGIAISLV